MIREVTTPSPPRRPLRILLSAFAFDPGGTSESALGWHIASGLAARGHDVTVIFGHLRQGPRDPRNLETVHTRCREAGNLRAVHIEGDRIAKFMVRLSGSPGLWWLFYRGYRRWQRQALRTARELQSAQPFDLTHHLNFIGFREPGEIWKLGLPHFWGPVSGSPMVPWAFLLTFSPGQFYRWGGRNIGNWWQVRTSRLCRTAALASSRIWAVSASDMEVVEKHWKVKADPLLETGARIASGSKVRSRQPAEALRIIWSGRFDPIKVLPVVFTALERVGDRPWELHILGDGPEKSRWKRAEASHSLAGKVVWHGMLPLDHALKVMDQGHVFLHSSVKEGTPHVVLEALGMGLPVICHDACGMGIAVNETCGIKVPLVDPLTSSSGFAKAIGQFLDDEGLVSRLSEGAIRRASELSWDSKIDAFVNAYGEVLHG